MPVDELSDVRVAVVRSIVGSRTFARGEAFARSRVLDASWHRAKAKLSATVVGDTGIYETQAYFNTDKAGRREFFGGECSCPVGVDCKHVVALVLAVVGDDAPATRPQGAPGVAPEPRRSPRPAWERTLGSLVEAPPTEAAAERPLAIGVELRSSSADPTVLCAPRLLARVMRRGRTNWVNGGLSWTGLDPWRIGREGFDERHLGLLRELYAVSRGRRGQSRYSYALSTEATLDIGAIDSPQLWPILDEAAAIGLPLVHATGRQTPLGRHLDGEVVVDITGGPSSALRARASVRLDVDDVDAVPVMFVGTSGHGAVCLEAVDGAVPADYRAASIRLVRLARPAPEALRGMVLESAEVAIPADDVAQFGVTMWPRLRHVVAVTSSDGAFAPPEISAPALVLHAAFGRHHDVTVRWEWAYDVGGTEHRSPLTADPHRPGFRDPDAERAVLDRLTESVGAELAGIAVPSAETVLLSGLDTMRLSTELFPMLDGHPSVRVDIAGTPADYREAGDTLVVGLSTVEHDGGTDWFDLGVTVTVDGHAVPFAELFVALDAGLSHMLLADGAYFSLEKPELQALRRLIEEAKLLQESQAGPLRISRFQIGLWDELVALGVVQHQADSWRCAVDALRSIESIAVEPTPQGLTAELRPYQHDGFGWLAFLWDQRLGGVLADDMGLGKTVQTLAMIVRARRAEPTGAPLLVVAPTSVASNWAAEAARFAPGLRVVTVVDTLSRSGRAIGDVVAGADVVVTSYTLFRLDHDAYDSVPWSALILDEAQAVKNHQSKIHSCARRLAAPFKLAITGTPMENNLMELWSLMSITAPGLFPSPTRFAEYYAKPIERGDDADRLAQLRRRIRPLMKRRTKEQVAGDLPDKLQHVLEVDLHPRHRAVYDRTLQRERRKVLGLVGDFNRNRFTILRSLTLLRQLSLHTGLVDAAHDAIPSAKIDALVEHLDDVVNGGHRALVFSQFTGFLGKVRKRLDSEGIDHCYLEGRTRRRDEVIERFKRGDASVFLISLKAGGFGLNLTEADYCFLLDPWWNPATEEQAIDRTHRIGQTRNVMVYRLIARDTIEDKVMALKARKAELFASVMDDGDLFAGRLDADDVRGLFA